ncbi:MAG: exodeoxyribonuclease III [Dongiaceae bacterium]
MSLRLVTWNVNSIRLRLDNLARLAETLAPDVLCLQETKVQDGAFPLEPLARLGYRHALVHGMKGYNGVAILSRRPFRACETKGWCGRADCRHAIVHLDGGIELHDVYVPSGGDVPDPQRNDKFAHKLQFLDELTAWFAARGGSHEKLILVGDLNVAPLATDVWSHKQLLSVVSHTPVEVARLERLQASLGWIDAVRRFIPPPQRLYSWWSYRAHDWAASDRGRRLDHVWVTPALAPSLRAAQVVREARGWDAPSDHVPVVVDLD